MWRPAMVASLVLTLSLFLGLVAAARCQPCHGERGRGDGPLAAALAPRPADLVLHAAQHSDEELFYVVTRGVAGTAMPAWREVLGAHERWEVVAYLRDLSAR